MTEPTVPDWDIWRHMPEVELWQACALSLNLDPEAFQFSSHGWMAGPGDHGPFVEAKSFRAAAEEKTFHKRLKLLKANFHKREHFSAGKLNLAQSYRHGVQLPEFAAWACGCGWELPAEFPRNAAPYSPMLLAQIQQAEARSLKDFERGALSLLVIAGMLSDSRGLHNNKARREMTNRVIRAAMAGAFPVVHRQLRDPPGPATEVTGETIADVGAVLRWWNKGNSSPIQALTLKGLQNEAYRVYRAEMSTAPAPASAELARANTGRPESAEPDSAVAPSGLVKHSTRPKSRNVLDPVIDLAQQNCLDPKDAAQVWVQMQVLADSEHPPLLASTASGIKYMKNGGDAYLTRDALDKRLKRRSSPLAAVRRR